MLAQLALVSFALFGLLALVVDIGIARVTQAQMQTAADAAALDGLRLRDVGVLDPATGQTVTDPFASDCLRRAAASRLVRAVFDDDLDPSAEDPAYAFGAGPIIELTEGETALHGAQLMTVPEPRVYEPRLQMNQQNVVEGDMVSGRFCYSDDPLAGEGASYALPGTTVCTEEQRGYGRYARNDFNPSPSAPQPPPDLPTCPPADEPPPEPWPLPGSGDLTTASDGAFLVRLKRSNELRTFAGQTEPDIASSGPALPLLFGRAALVHGDDPTADYSVRRDGLTVRATAIAEVRPAMHVGLPQTTPYQPGVLPFALVDTYVRTITPAGVPVTINPANGVICSGNACAGGNPPTAVGRFVDTLTDPTHLRWRTISTVGQVLPASTPVACGAAREFAGFGPVYSAMASGTSRIIGFARLDLSPDAARPGNPCAAVLARGVSLVAASNATAAVTTGLLPIGTSPAELRELLDKNLERDGRIVYGALLAPVLAR